jgi:hypothetical protein
MTAFLAAALIIVFGVLFIAFLVWLDWRLQQIADDLRRLGLSLTPEEARTETRRRLWERPWLP